MEQRWKIIDTVMAIILVFILGCTFLFGLAFYMNFFAAKEVMEEEIQFKMSETGFYFGPFYKAYSESSGMHHITKQQYEEADVLTGYKTDRSSFFTGMDMLVELGGFLLIVIVLLGICLLLIYYFYWKFNKKRRNTQTSGRKTTKKATTILLFGFIGISSLVLLFLCWNTFQQVIPVGQTKTEAQILDREIIKRTGRYAWNEYYVTMLYEDSSGNPHIAKQRVSAGLYEKYEHEYGMSVRYVNRQPANTFIVLQSLEDVVWMVLLKNMVIILFLFYVYERMYRWTKKDSK